jgi:catechol 2,3-dioxygenase
MTCNLIHPATRIGTVHLTVADLDRARRFYETTLGFRALPGGGSELLLGADDVPLLALTARPGARPKPAHATGLYHFAILVPDRRSLARSLRRLAEQGYPLGGASDHGVSEALYLSDPDENGIEIYRDRPRDAWPRDPDGHQAMVTQPLDLRDLLAAGDATWDGLAAGTRIGHIHLHVADLAAAEEFYCGTLGFELMQHYGHSAAFVSAGGYHHHIGLNTWAGVGAPPPPDDAAGLRYVEVVLPDAAEVERVVARAAAAGFAGERHGGGVLLRDPSHNGVLLVAAAARQPPGPP